jgi:7,8-dihydroneopterin aldolase/epimerase/oxygenase
MTRMRGESSPKEGRSMADRIHIQGVEFYGFHGVSAAEREIGHRYIVDVEVETDLREGGRTDDLSATLDYGAVIALVLEIGQGEGVRLMETLAHRIAGAVLERFAAARSVRVAVSKRLPPVAAVVACAGVEIVRTREDDAASG